MSISFYYQIHIDTIKKSLESLDVAQAYKIVDDLLECKGKIFFTGIGKNLSLIHI